PLSIVQPFGRRASDPRVFPSGPLGESQVGIGSSALAKKIEALQVLPRRHRWYSICNCVLRFSRGVAFWAVKLPVHSCSVRQTTQVLLAWSRIGDDPPPSMLEVCGAGLAGKASGL